MVLIQEISSEPLGRNSQTNPSGPTGAPSAYQPATSTPVSQYPPNLQAYGRPIIFGVRRTIYYQPASSNEANSGYYTRQPGYQNGVQSNAGKKNIDTEKLKRMATMAAKEAVRGTEQLLRQTADALRGLQGQSNSYYQRRPQNTQNARGSNVRIIVDGNVVYDGPANGRYDMYTQNGEHIKIYY